MFRHLFRGLRALANRKAVDQDIADEVASYLEQAAAALVESGLSPDEARRVARLGGNETTVREQVRSYGWENAVAAPFSDLRYAGRRLRGSPGFTAVSVLTLALGIGASTAIFSVIEGVLLKPLPYLHSGQIVELRHTAPGINIPYLNLAASLYFTYKEEGRVFQDVGMWMPDTATITGIGEPEEVRCLSVTDRFLPVLGVQPALGRGFTAFDNDPKSEPTVILSDGYWQSRFGGDRTVIGRRIMVDGNPREVIGILPPSFQFLDRQASLLAPLRFNRAAVRLISFCCQGVARLKPGVTLAQANADVARMLPMAPAKFAVNPGFSPTMFADARIAPRLRLLRDLWVGNIGNTLWLLMGTVEIVLLIACANVANLRLVRAGGRRQELAVRAALGAGWGRIARELLLESALLGVAGGAVGLALAYAALRLLLRRSGELAAHARDLDRSGGAGVYVGYFAGRRFGIRPDPGLQVCAAPSVELAAQRRPLSQRKQGAASCAQPSGSRAGGAGAGPGGRFGADDPNLPGATSRRSRFFRCARSGDV